MPNWYPTQGADLAVQSAGLAGLTNLKADVLVTPLPSPPERLGVIGDFVLAAYTGYAQASVVLTGGYVDGFNGPVYAESGLIAFNGPSSGAGVNALGVILTDGTSHAVWGYLTLDNPVPLQVSTDRLALVLQLKLTEPGVITVVP